jgi:hypothetical protein
LRETHPDIQLVMVGSAAGAAAKAGDLCAEGPALTKPYDHKQVHEHIKRLIAARDRNRGGG